MNFSSEQTSDISPPPFEGSTFDKTQTSTITEDQASYDNQPPQMIQVDLGYGQEQQYVQQYPEEQKQERPDSNFRISNPFVFNENNEINISVGEPITKESTLSRHTSYNIKGEDKIGPFDLYRRFSEFYALKEVLSARWPGCFIPSIPAKEMNSTSQNVVNNRQRFLNSFCNQLAKLPHLFYSEEFQLFLRSKDSDVTKQLSYLKKVSLSEIITKLNESFPQVSSESATSDLLLKINSWYIFLKRCINQMKSQKESLKSLSNLRNEMNKQFTQLNYEIFPEYEKCIISQYVSNDLNQLVISNPNTTYTQDFLKKFDVSQDKNSYQHLYDMVKFELRDAEAFESAILEKENLEKKKFTLINDIKDDQDDLNKLQSGKKTVKAFLSSSDSQIKKLIQKIEQVINAI